MWPMSKRPSMDQTIECADDLTSKPASFMQVYLNEDKGKGIESGGKKA